MNSDGKRGAADHGRRRRAIPGGSRVVAGRDADRDRRDAGERGRLGRAAGLRGRPRRQVADEHSASGERRPVVGDDRVLFAAFDGIFEAATSGGPPRALVAGAWAPALSPDRSRLAYVAWRGALRALHVADASGRNPRCFSSGENTRPVRSRGLRTARVSRSRAISPSAIAATARASPTTCGLSSSHPARLAGSPAIPMTYACRG